LERLFIELILPQHTARAEGKTPAQEQHHDVGHKSPPPPIAGEKMQDKILA